MFLEEPTFEQEKNNIEDDYETSEYNIDKTNDEPDICE